MERLARAKSESGIYQAIVRGINRQNILHDEEDECEYLNVDDNEQCMEYDEESRLSDRRALELICQVGKVNNSQKLQNIAGEFQNQILWKLKLASLSI